jgi:carbamate kinase
VRLFDKNGESIKHVEAGLLSVSKIVVYAIGGNALAPPGGVSGDQHAMILAQVMSDVVDLLEADWSVVLTHGNGPQVGALMSMDSDLIHTMDEWVAATQGMIGHTLSLQLNSILSHRHRPERTAVVLTRVLVDSSDEAFSLPTKPVGPILSAEEVMVRDWDIATTINGPRRVVASPMPMSVLDIDVIRTLVQQRAVVICGGGGGIPIVNEEKQFKGIPSVIDKDRLSALLATELGAEALIISTGVDAVYTDFGSENQKEHRALTVSQAEKYLSEGQFPDGSMGPKISSMIQAVRHSSNMRSILCKPGDALSALREDAGTTLSHDD